VGTIREFVRDDIGPAADLWMRLVGERTEPAPPSLKEYFERIYFGNPWYDREVPSYVYEDGGRILGFLGAMQRPMMFRGQSIRAAVLCGVMVDKIENRRQTATAMMQKFVDGPQDLSFTDCARPAAVRIWQACGGAPAFIYCLDWTRLLRPTRHLMGLASRRKGMRVAAAVAAPLLSAVDAAAARAPFGPFRAPAGEAAEMDEASPETLIDCIAEFTGDKALRPRLDAAGFDWLLSALSQSFRRERLHSVVVRGEGGRRVGWFVYYLEPGGTAQVLQLGGKASEIRPVLDSLFHHASREGAVAVTGQAIPELVYALSESHCRFRSLSLGMLVHARHQEIVNAIHRGDAFLSRSEGEWWIRFPAFA
jgi:hypothetical protein